MLCRPWTKSSAPGTSWYKPSENIQKSWINQILPPFQHPEIDVRFQEQFLFTAWHHFVSVQHAVASAATQPVRRRNLPSKYLETDIFQGLIPMNITHRCSTSENCFVQVRNRIWINEPLWTTSLVRNQWKGVSKTMRKIHTHHPLSIELKELLKTSCWIPRGLPPLKKTWSWKPSAPLVWASPCPNQRRVLRTSSCKSCTSLCELCTATCRNESPLKGNITIIEGYLQLQTSLFSIFSGWIYALMNLRIWEDTHLSPFYWIKGSDGDW